MDPLSKLPSTTVHRGSSSSTKESASPTQSPRSSTTVREAGGSLAGIPGSRQTEPHQSTRSIDQQRQRPTTLPTTMQSPGDTRALLHGSPLPASPEIGVGHVGETSAAASSSAVTSPHHAVLARLEDEFKAAAQRDVHPEEAAALINELRRHGPRAHADPGVTPAATNDELMSHVTEEHVQAWFHAQGVSPEQAADMRHAAFMSGLPNPSGTLLTNALQFIASPWLSKKTHNPWSGAGLGIATAFASAPLNALQQSAVVTTGESMRAHGGPVVVPDKKSINDEHYLPELAKQLEGRVKEFAGLHEAATRFAESHGLDLQALHEEMAAAHEAGGTAPLPRALAELPAGALDTLRQHGQRLLAAEQQLHLTQRDFLMTQGAHERQWTGNTVQAIPRTIRSPAAGLFSLLGKHGSGIAGPIAQTVASMVLTAGQHLAAGFDERNKQDYNNKLNLMYGNCLKETGHAKLARGEDVAAEDIDRAKLRGFMQFPEQSFITNVAKELKADIDILAAVLAVEGPAASAAEQADLARDREALARLTADSEHLASGEVTKLHSGGLAEQLLVGTAGGVMSEVLRRQVVAKYTLREFSAQTAQRFGQMFHMGALGSAVPSIAGKVVSAVLGGVKKTPVGVVVGLAAASGVMAGVGALSTHTAISVKNNRRESDPDIGLVAQVGRGMTGGLNEFRGQRTGKQASKAMNEKLAEEQVNQTLQFAHDLVALTGEVELAENLSLEEAGEQLNQGHQSAASTDEISIKMPAPESEASTSGHAQG